MSSQLFSLNLRLFKQFIGLHIYSDRRQGGSDDFCYFLNEFNLVWLNLAERC
jgi:hypothetical protein